MIKPVSYLKTHLRKIIGTGLIVGSVALFVGAGLIGYSYLQVTTHQKAATQTAVKRKVDVPTQTVAVKAESVQGIPIKIEIPSVGISQPVEKGEYDASSGEWTLSYHAAYWATMTAPINSDTGNTFIYGHDVKEIFGNLLDATIGAKAIVTTDNGYVFTYTLVQSKAVDPTDVSQIQPTEAPTLTLQTCSGTWYQYRQMFTFSLDGYDKLAA